MLRQLQWKVQIYMNRSYSELIKLPTFLERFNYLQLYGKVGSATFGDQRYLNQTLYRLPEWKRVRNEIIIRDNACDLAHPDYQIDSQSVYIHHINPITVQDILDRNFKVFDHDNLVTTTFATHQAIHYGGQEVKKMLLVDRCPNDTCPWK